MTIPMTKVTMENPRDNDVRRFSRIRRCNSNGEDVAPTVDCCYRKGVSNQMAGGGVFRAHLPLRRETTMSGMPLTSNCGAVCAVKSPVVSVPNAPTIGSSIIYAVQTKISYDLNREVAPCVISSNYKEPIAIVEVK